MTAVIFAELNVQLQMGTDSSSASTYQYKALSENSFFRLLDLKPATSVDADLYCELIESDRSLAPEYEALSYVWGKEEFPNSLNLSGGCLMITDNLALALRRLRLAHKSRLLWVDAVCINQSDGAEKGRQVAQMASTYKNAARVVAWLGEDSGRFFDKDAIISLSQQAKEIGLQSSQDDNRDIIRKWVYGNSQRVTWALNVTSAVEDAKFPSIYESAWFTRMWIVQEAILADRLTLYFGPAQLDWDDFQRVMVLIHGVNAAFRLPIPSREFFIKQAWSLIEVRDHWYQPSPGRLNQASEIKYYMHQLRRRSCKDDRDRVFALKGLLRDESTFDIQPDYSKSAVQVYTDMARSQLNLGNISVLYDAGLWKRKFFHIPDSRSEDSNESLWSEYLPTWAPDYRSNSTFMELDAYFGTYFGSDPSVSLKLDLSKESYRLVSQATLIDIIVFTQPASFVHDQAFRANDIAMFFMCCQFCKDLKRVFDSRFESAPYPTQEDPTTAFAYALIGGGTDEAYKNSFILNHTAEPPNPLSLWKTYEKCCLEENGEVHQAMRKEAEMTGNRKTLRGIGSEFYSEAGAESSMAWNYHQHLVSIFRRHSFFISDDGYAGLAPWNTQAKDLTDVLAFIDGANVPFVLRDLGEDVLDYVLVGPCYIYGLMDGEMVKQNKAFSAGTIQII